MFNRNIFIRLQIVNFLKFVEMLVKADCGVKRVRLKTGVDAHEPAQQREKLGQIANSMLIHHVTLEVQYSDTLHDREIRCLSTYHNILFI